MSCRIENVINFDLKICLQFLTIFFFKWGEFLGVLLNISNILHIFLKRPTILCQKDNHDVLENSKRH